MIGMSTLERMGWQRYSYGPIPGCLLHPCLESGWEVVSARFGSYLPSQISEKASGANLSALISDPGLHRARQDKLEKRRALNLGFRAAAVLGVAIVRGGLGLSLPLDKRRRKKTAGSFLQRAFRDCMVPIHGASGYSKATASSMQTSVRSTP